MTHQDLSCLAASALSRMPRRLRWKIARRLYPGAAHWAQRLPGSGDSYTLRGMQARNCLFVHVPKCAGLAVTETLFGDKGGAHASLRDYLYVCGAPWIDQAFKFGFVRDPLSRTISAFDFLRRGGLNRWDTEFAETHLARFADVNDFVLHGLGTPAIMNYVHFRPQVSFLTDPRTGRIGMDFIGRFERIDADFAAIGTRLGMNTPLLERNCSSRAGRPAALSSQAVVRILSVYREDYAAFQYGAVPGEAPAAPIPAYDSTAAVACPA